MEFSPSEIRHILSICARQEVYDSSIKQKTYLPLCRATNIFSKRSQRRYDLCDKEECLVGTLHSYPYSSELRTLLDSKDTFLYLIGMNK
jgi:hypothetical protein